MHASAGRPTGFRRPCDTDAARRRPQVVAGDIGRCCALPDVPAGKDAEQKRDDQHDGDGHEQEDQLLAIQLYFAETFVAHDFVSTPVISYKKALTSIGRGKTIVEQFSREITWSILARCRIREAVY